MRYNYRSSGILSKPIFEHKDETIASQSNRNCRYEFKQALTQRIEEANYGTIGTYGSEGIGSNTTDGRGGILIVGEVGRTFIDGSAVCNHVIAHTGTNTYVGSGSTTISGAATGTRYIPHVINNIGSGSIYLFGKADLIYRVRYFGTGNLFTSGGSAECSVRVYKPDIVEDYNELDYGSITDNHTNTIDNGLVSELGAVTIERRGHILNRTQTRFGFKRVIGEAQAKATNAWIGEGSLISFGAQDSPAIYGYITDGKVRIFGSADSTFTTTKLGGGLTPLSGTAITNIAPSISGDGSFKKFGGSAESATFNPQEKDLLFSFTGGLTSEKHTESWLGSGQLRNLAKLEKERSTFGYAGSGGFTFQPENAIEKNTESYNQSAVVRFARVDYGTIIDNNLVNCVLDSGVISTDTTASSGCIKIAPGTTLAVAPSNTYTIPSQQTIPSSYIDYGNVADGAAPVIDYGHILDNSDLVPYGLFKLKSVTDVTVKQQYAYLGTQGTLKLSGKVFTPIEPRHTGSGSIFVIGGAAECSVKDVVGSGTERISGEVVDSVGLNYIGSGSLKKFSGASESLTFNPLEKDLLFSFTGGITSEKHVESYTGSGFLRNFAKLEAEKGVFNWVGSGIIKLKPRKPDILEESHEKHTEVYNNSACVDGVDLDYGFLVDNNLTNCVLNSGIITTDTTATSGCIKIAPSTTLAIAPGFTYTIPNQLTVPSVTEDYGLISDLNAPERRDYSHILGTLSKVCPFGAFDITGTATSFFIENVVSSGSSVSGKAGITLFGDADVTVPPQYPGSGTIFVTGTVGESFTPTTEIGSGILYAFSGSAESTSITTTADGLFKIGSEAYILFSLLHPGSGVIRVTGTGAESTSSEHTGSGSLRKLSGAAESATFNPLERQMLFSFTGVGGEVFTANPPEEGTQVRISGDAFPVFFVPEYPGSGLIKVTGEGDTDRTRTFIGSGLFKKFSGAAESISFNPLEKQLLFSFIGSCTEAFIANPPEEVAQILISGEAIPKVRVHEDVFGTISIFGDALFKKTKPFIGSGSLKKFSGAAEVVAFNPLERQLLFSFTGTGSENTVAVPPKGDGRLFAFSSSTVVSAVAHETTGLFRVSGDAATQKVPRYKGSGSLKKFSGAAEALTFNPTEEQMLFSFTGQGSDSTSSVEIGSGGFKIYPEASDIRFIPNWNSVGGIKLYVYGDYRFAPVWIGSGTLRKFSGAAESLTFNPLEKQMLFSFTGQASESRLAREISKGGTVKINGIATDKFIPNNIGSGTIFVTGDADAVRARDFVGSGSLRKLSGAAESRRIDITTLPSLFRVYGDGDIARSRPYIGSGSLRKLSGAAESLTFNPDEKQMLFSFLGQGKVTKTNSKVGQGTVKTLGNVIDRFSPVYIGSGTARVLGDANVVRARDFIGFGSLRKLSGTAEALTFNPLEKQMLFSFTGIGADSRTSKLLSQGGTLAVRGTSGDPLLTFAEQPRVEIDIAGDSTDLRVRAYQGSGSIRNLNSLDESFTRDGYEGSGTFTISGIALIQVQLFQPPFTQVWII